MFLKVLVMPVSVFRPFGSINKNKMAIGTDLIAIGITVITSK